MFALLLVLGTISAFADCTEELRKGEALYNKARTSEVSSREYFTEAEKLASKDPRLCNILQNALLEANNANQSYFLSEVAYTKGIGICSVEMQERNSQIASKNSAVAMAGKERSSLIIELAFQEINQLGCQTKDGKTK